MLFFGLGAEFLVFCNYDSVVVDSKDCEVLYQIARLELACTTGVKIPREGQQTKPKKKTFYSSSHTSLSIYAWGAPGTPTPLPRFFSYFPCLRLPRIKPKAPRPSIAIVDGSGTTLTLNAVPELTCPAVPRSAPILKPMSVT